jgi:hypothetical protein
LNKSSGDPQFVGLTGAALLRHGGKPAADAPVLALHPGGDVVFPFLD